jgi:hypothetical protein
VRDLVRAAPARGNRAMPHAYPADFARFLTEYWDSLCASASGLNGETPDTLPPPVALGRILEVGYHSSFLQNELRPIRFRLVVREPSRFPAGEGPPRGLHTLLFSEALLLDETLVRQLALAVEYSRGLLGVWLHGDRPVLWGIVRSGPRWLHDTYGRAVARPLPPAFTLHVLGPGSLAVGVGDLLIGELRGGAIRRESMSVFESEWLREQFLPIRREILARHEEERARQADPWASLDAEIVRYVAQHMLRRCLAAVRAAQHGATLIVVPPDRTMSVLGSAEFVDLKFTFVDDEPRRRFRTLILRAMAELAASEGRRGCAEAGWREYETSTDPALEAMDEAIFEVADLVADLATIDGAVVMTQRFEILGFGAEISAGLPAVDLVARALDLEGSRYLLESTAHVGTRHRSAFRLCHAMPEALVVVVSQDGTVRFVRWQEGRVTYWDHGTF